MAATVVPVTVSELPDNGVGRGIKGKVLPNTLCGWEETAQFGTPQVIIGPSPHTSYFPDGIGNLPVPPGYEPGGRLRRTIFPKRAYPQHPVVHHSGRQLADRHRQVPVLPIELHCALKTGYTVTSLSISNLAGYKSVTHQLHGYIVVHQQLSQQKSGVIRPKPDETVHSVVEMLPAGRLLLPGRTATPIENKKVFNKRHEASASVFKCFFHPLNPTGALCSVSML